jgi:hypothetical protein
LSYVVKLNGRVVGHITSKVKVLDKMIATLIEPCLLTYGVKVYLGDEARTPRASGFRLEGKTDTVATAVKRCIAFVLHRVPEIEEEELYEVKPKKTTPEPEATEVRVEGVELEE